MPRRLVSDGTSCSGIVHCSIAHLRASQLTLPSFTLFFPLAHQTRSCVSNCSPLPSTLELPVLPDSTSPPPIPPTTHSLVMPAVSSPPPPPPPHTSITPVGRDYCSSARWSPGGGAAKKPTASRTPTDASNSSESYHSTPPATPDRSEVDWSAATSSYQFSEMDNALGGNGGAGSPVSPPGRGTRREGETERQQGVLLVSKSCQHLFKLTHTHPFPADLEFEVVLPPNSKLGMGITHIESDTKLHYAHGNIGCKVTTVQKGSAAAKTGKILPHDWVRPRVPVSPRP